MQSPREDILNGVISFITKISDYHADTNGLMVVRRYEDGPRPTNSTSGSSCENYSNDVFGEISLESFSYLKTCKSTERTECNSEEDFYLHFYDVEVELGVFGCGAFDVAIMLINAIKIPQLRMRSLPNGLSYKSHGPITDVTALQETMHEERVTVTINFEYCQENSFVHETINLSSCLDGYIS